MCNDILSVPFGVKCDMVAYRAILIFLFLTLNPNHTAKPVIMALLVRHSRTVGRSNQSGTVSKCHHCSYACIVCTNTQGFALFDAHMQTKKNEKANMIVCTLC